MVYKTNFSKLALRDAYKTRVLIVDNELAIRRYLHIVLKAQDYEVYEALNVQFGLNQVMSIRPDLILADLMLPDANGIDFIHKFHEIARIPILILCVYDHVAQKIEALDAGAEDYIVKPFNVDELLARIRVALRRTRRIKEVEIFSSGNLKVDFIRRMVSVNDKNIDLTLTEYELLHFLILHADQPVTHEQLWKAVRDENILVDTHGVRVHVSNLRHKLGQGLNDLQHIVTEVGIGYRFQTNKFPLFR